MDKEIFALYLPQYHEIPENNKWWGKGYTEWNAVKNAKAFFKGHVQPKIPLNNNYYDLSDESGKVWKWQTRLANKYGVSGFVIYHYWFEGGKKLLEKPMEILLNHKEIDIQYFVCWANEPWKRTWYQNNGQVLMPQDYGDLNDWIKHYNYLRPFFLDERYKKINNCPVIAIYKTRDIEQLEKMKNIWSELAQKDGFSGVYIMGAKTAMEQENRENIVDGEYLFEPAYTMHYQYNYYIDVKRGISKIIRRFFNKFLKINLIENIENIEDLYKSIHLPPKLGKDIFYGICPSWDNTPRKQEKGCVFLKSSPKKFEKKLGEILNAEDGGKLIIINAWNEWGEGAYLEPDEENKYAYLEAIRNATNREVVKECDLE